MLHVNRVGRCTILNSVCFDDKSPDAKKPTIVAQRSVNFTCFDCSRLEHLRQRNVCRAFAAVTAGFDVESHLLVVGQTGQACALDGSKV